MANSDESFGGYYDGGTEIPNNVGGEPNAGGEADAFSVPSEYAEKGYTKDLKTYDDVWKKLDGAESLLGKPKEGGVPVEGADDAAWETFYKSAGRPETAADYKFNREGLNEDFISKTTNDEMDNLTKDLFLKAGLSQKQVGILQPEFEKMAEEMHFKQQEQVLAQDKLFDELAQKTFGEREDAVMATAKQLLNDHAPEGFSDFINDLPNESLVVMAGVLDSIKTKYISEDSIKLPSGNLGGGSEQALREEARKLMSSDDYRNSFAPNHDNVVKEVADIYEKIGKIA